MTHGPPCSCHGVPRVWRKDKRCTAGGFWRCAVSERDWNRSEAGRAAKVRNQERTIRVHVGDSWYTYRVRPERKDELKAQLAEFRLSRKQEDSLGRIDKTTP